MIGVSETFQVLPKSEERKTRATFPPVANHAWPLALTAIQVPLAAKAPSPSMAGGSDPDGIGFQDLPASSVSISWNFPFTGSPIAIPLLKSQSAMQSKKPFGSTFVN